MGYSGAELNSGAERLAEILRGLGCTDVAVLEGGTPAWGAAGYELFSGVNVPSKAFGEWVEHHYGTPGLDAAELRHVLGADRELDQVEHAGEVRPAGQGVKTGAAATGG